MSMIAEGTIIRRGDGQVSEAFTAIAEVMTASGVGGGSPTVIDVSHLGSSFREKKLGIRDEGQVSLGLRWLGTDTEQQGLWTDRANGTERNFQIEYPDGTIDEFAAFVMSMETSVETDSDVTHEVTLEITGQVSRDWGSSGS